MTEIDLFWNRFLDKTGRDKDIKYMEVFHFELTEYWANELLRMVLKGKKRATCSSLNYWEITGSKLPEMGDISIVTDWEGTPRCVIGTTNITILPFKDMTYDICKREGEDECLETWIKGHTTFFTEEGKELGYEFSGELIVVFEDFEVIYQE